MKFLFSSEDEAWEYFEKHISQKDIVDAIRDMSDEELLDMFDEWSGGDMEVLIDDIIAEKMQKVTIKKEG